VRKHETGYRLFGEAHFLRAFAFNELVQVFGAVPLRINSRSTEKLPHASIEEIYEQIGVDLKNAIELMPDKIYLDNYPMVGHTNKYATEALMARVFLFYTGRYDKTELPRGITKSQIIGWIDDCVNNSGHELVSDISNDKARGSMLSILGVCYGIGALVMLLLLGMFSRTYSYQIILQGTGLCMMAAVLYFILINFPEPKIRQEFPVKEAVKLIKEPLILFLSFFLFLQSDE